MRTLFVKWMIVGIVVALFSQVLSGLPQAWAVEPELSRFAGTDGLVDWEKAGPKVSRPNAFQIEFFRKLESFDQAYFQWQAKKVVNAQQWEKLANNVFGKYENMPLEGENGPFILRGKLIKGECFLFAAVDQMKNNQKAEALKNYRKGLRLLQTVVMLEDVIWTVNNIKLGELPDYRKQEVSVLHKKNQVIHPYAGYETIGTGVRWVQGVTAGLQEIKSVASGNNYRTIDVLQEGLRKHLEFVQSMTNIRSTSIPSHGGSPPQSIRSYHQKSTVETARDLLSDFCPWGLEMFFLMEQAGLSKDLDFRILRPFSGYTPTLGEKFIKGLKQFPDAVMGRPVESQDKIPPVISELVLKPPQPPQIPKHIFNEMNLIIGAEGKGYLDTFKKRPIKWEWVEKEPTYTIWYISPTVFDWQPSDYLWMWFTAVKLYFSPAGAILDEVISQLTNSIGSIYGQKSDIYFTAKVFVEANDKGFLATNFIEKGEWLSAAAVTRKVASFAFSAVEEQMRKDRFEGIDPRKFSLGKTYNGGAIPPIIIRSDVFGFEQVPDDEYPRTVQAVRFYLLHPENIAHKGPYQEYDLSNASSPGGMSALYRREQYLLEQRRFQAGGTTPEPVRKLAWNRLPDDLAAFEIVTDFAPKKQIIKVPLSEDTTQTLLKTEGVRVQLWSSSLQKSELCINMPISGKQRIFSMELYNKKVPESRIEYGRKAPAYPPPADLSSGPPDPAELQDYYKARDSYLRDKNHCLFNIKNQYILKFVQNDKVIDVFTVIFNRGRKNQRKITGKISSPEVGVVVLDYDPPIKIKKVEVEKGRIVPGKQSEE